MTAVLAAGGLFALIWFVSVILESIDPTDWDDPWSEPLWTDNGERPGDIAGTFPVVQLNRVTGQYDTILGGYRKQEGGDN